MVIYAGKRQGLASEITCTLMTSNRCNMLGWFHPEDGIGRRRIGANGIVFSGAPIGLNEFTGRRRCWMLPVGN
jgi:hypothetical protein